MRAVIIGMGSIGRRHVRNLRDLGIDDIMALRTRLGHLKELPGELNVVETESWDKIRNFNPDIAIVSNPTSLHVETAIRMLPLVRGVFIEKPLGSSLSEIDRLIAGVKKNHTVTFMGYQLEFHPIVNTISTALNSGSYGRPLCYQGSVGFWLPDWHPDEDYRINYAARSDLGGGVALTLIHEVQMALRWFGPVEMVIGTFPANDRLKLDVDVQADMMMRHGNNMISQLHMDYLQKPFHREGNISCESGWIRYDFASNRVVAQTENDRYPAVLWENHDYNLNMCYRKMMETFVAYATEGRQSHDFDVYTGLQGLLTVLAAYESVGRQGWVKPKEIGNFVI